MALNPAKWTKVPIDMLLAAHEGGFHMVYKDRWWAVDKDGNAFFYDKSPQCNSNKAIVERLHTHPDMVDVVFVSYAYVPVSIHDYT